MIVDKDGNDLTPTRARTMTEISYTMYKNLVNKNPLLNALTKRHLVDENGNPIRSTDEQKLKWEIFK